MRLEIDDYEKDLLIDTIQHRLDTDKILVINNSLREEVEDLLRKVEEDEYTPRTLITVSDLKYNHDDEILVGGCINNDGDYRQFFLENMTNIQCWQKIYVEI